LKQSGLCEETSFVGPWFGCFTRLGARARAANTGKSNIGELMYIVGKQEADSDGCTIPNGFYDG
jgi:hypothetical protein